MSLRTPGYLRISAAGFSLGAVWFFFLSFPCPLLSGLSVSFKRFAVCPQPHFLSIRQAGSSQDHLKLLCNWPVCWPVWCVPLLPCKAAACSGLSSDPCHALLPVPTPSSHYIASPSAEGIWVCDLCSLSPHHSF